MSIRPTEALCHDSCKVRAGVYSLLVALLLLLTPLARAQDDPALLETVRAVEERLDARLGMLVRDTGDGRSVQYRAAERFPMTSTFKTLACAALLQRVDQGSEDLARRVVFEEHELVSYSPISSQHVGPPGMSLGELCAATLAVSDNSAANFILDALGGPEALTAFLRSSGDQHSRLDRRETALNEAVPGDLRDTTTPAAMADTLERLLLSDLLSLTSRRQLWHWLEANEVADSLFRASLPNGWRIADRSGAGGYGSRSLTAVILPPEREPVIVTVYLTESGVEMPARDTAIAEIGAAVMQWIMKSRPEE